MKSFIDNKILFYILIVAIVCAICPQVWGKSAFVPTLVNKSTNFPYRIVQADTVPPDSIPPLISQPDNNPLNEDHYSPFDLHNTSGVGTVIHYNPETNTYEFQYMTGNTPYGPGAYMDINEYIDYDLRRSIDDYWRNQGAGYTGGNRKGSGLIPELHVGGDIFESIFGSNTIDIRPAGNVTLTFGVNHTFTDNKSLPEKQRKTTNFNFDEDIQLNLIAKIGDKIEFNLNYSTDQLSVNTKTDQVKLKYAGKEDDILQLIEFGNVTLPLNSTLITGSQNLFGVKTQLKFGNLLITAVASQKNSTSQTMTITGGAESQKFEFRADEYEENKHYFLGEFFRDHYNGYLSTLPLVGSPIVITKIEVWRTTVGAATADNRNIVAFTDLGEADPEFSGLSYNPAYNGGQYPDNYINNLNNLADTSLIRNIASVSNNLHSIGMKSGVNYEKVESARLLSTSEYTVNTKLGFISLNTALNSDQVLAVAFQYTVIGSDKVYQVGEFSNEVSAPNCIRVKLLKSNNLDTKSPLWKLMMKNVYSLGAYQVSSDKFRFNILYTGDEEGVKNGFFTQGEQKGIPLIRLVGLDRLNQQQDVGSDGIFDFIDGASTNGGTINATNGRVYFPTVEPFGADLRAVITDPTLADKYAFDSLYTTTKTLARQITNKNKYYLEGSYQSSYGSEYYFSAQNVSEGSVKVTAGGIELTENVDYTVNYDMGTVTITNEGYLNSGTPISISVESDNSMATDQYMFGANFDYVFSKDFTVGATLLNLRERPYTNKVNYGDEPINNLLWGMNFAYKVEVPFITKLVNWITFHSTATQTFLNLEGEFAHFVPGHSRAIGKTGTTYIDDFESSKSTVDLTTFSNWVLASTPQGQPELFPEAHTVSTTDNARKQLAYGYNRAKLAWYIIDPLFYNSTNATPSNLTDADLSTTYARAVYETELFPYTQQPNTALSTYMSVFNLAFYPTERGPYNYDVSGSEGYSSGINEDGTLRNPETRWGGVMRKFDNTDFESYNYEYIEFWMMDPFIDNPNHTGGKLYFNLGDISEDILRDGVKFFENGLPADGSDDNVEFTVWGRVPTIQLIVNAFDNVSDSRQYQDVGYDGLQDERERTYFNDNYLQLISNLYGTSSAAYTEALNDPSGDNFHYFRGTDYDEADIKITERYKKYNNPDGNSPTDAQSAESYPTSGSNLPNLEDMNNDNTLSEDEKYYQYVIDLEPDKMVVGENYINDIFDAVPSKLPDGSRPTTRWYQFRIPIHNPDKVVNNMSGYNSIRFMRVFLRGFSEPVICRFATFDLVRGDWRTYNLSLQEEGDYLPTQGDGEGSFYVGTVSYEENANRTPIPYVLPPGIQREQGYGGTNIYLTNEQALTMKAIDLPDGDSRAIYKSTGYDLRQFNNLQMFIHAEDVYSSGDLSKGDITTFIRLGSDYTENYYEYEIPVEITPWTVGQDTNAIWPEANRMKIYLDSLVALKLQRNVAVRQGHHTDNTVPYSVTTAEGNKITVVGMPNLEDVTTIMIGVRNPKKKTANDGDDMQAKSVEVWVNELRLCGFDDRSGFAALLRARMNIADIGDLTVSGTYTTPGFGSIEQSVTERSTETSYTFDLATNIDGGKVLFPEKWNIKIPIHFDYSLGYKVPEYNPLNPDVFLKQDLATYETAAERDSIRRLVSTFTERKNVNLMNIRKERSMGGKNFKMHPWDIENLDMSYSYSELKQHDVDLEMNNEYTHSGEIGYTFSTNPKNYRPLSRVKWLKSKWLQLFRDFNFTPLPKNVTIRTGLTREMTEFKYRPKSEGNIIIDTSYVKTFDWTRTYNVNWDLTQGLKFQYNANATARIDEPDGRIDTRTEKDSVWKCLGRGGRTTDFSQTFSGTYQIPINKIPLFNWVSANVRYSSSYLFDASALSLAYLGNTIQNSNTMQGNGTLNMVTLYNNIPYLKKINQASGRRAPATIKKDDKKNKDKKDNGEWGDSNKKDSLKEKPNYGKIILDGTLRVLMLVRNISVNYSEGNGTVLPGYMFTPNIMGIHVANNSPGFLFVFGAQPDIQSIAAQKGWLTTDSLMNSAYQRTHNQVINFRASVEPFKDFRIDVTASRNFTQAFTEYFHVDESGEIAHYTPVTSGSFSITYCALKTFFSDYETLFEDFRASRITIAQRLAQENPNCTGDLDENGFPVGYSSVSQDVLIGAFLSSYMGKNADKIDLSTPFMKIPLPNWRLTYNGFSKIKGIDKVFQSLSITHNYTCTYQIGNYSTNVEYDETNQHPSATNTLGNFIPTYEVSQIALSEQFGPLIGFDMTLKNSMLLKVEYKQNRNVAVSFTNNQITETSAKELSISAGYRFKDLKIGLIFSGTKKQFVSDLNVTAGFGIKNNMTILRKIEEDVNQISAGTTTITINANAEYQFSKMLSLSFYYDQTINRPKIDNQYRNMNFETGIKVKLILAQ